MKSINEMIITGVKTNEKELKGDLSKFVNNLFSNINYELKIGYNSNSKLLDIEYRIKKEEKGILVQFQMDNDVYFYNAVDITKELLNFASNYFENKDLKVKMGNSDGEFYVSIEDYMNSFDEETKTFLNIWDLVTEDEIR